MDVALIVEECHTTIPRQYFGVSTSWKSVSLNRLETQEIVSDIGRGFQLLRLIVACLIRVPL
jgi:hypothetical protein